VCDFLLELFDIFRGLHTHKFHGVLFNELNNFFHSSKDWVFIPLIEYESLGFPNCGDVVKLDLDLRFFGCTFNKLSNLLSESMELELD
jgi:hypothetical protein